MSDADAKHERQVEQKYMTMTQEIEIITDHLDIPKWICPNCQMHNKLHYVECWSCEFEVPTDDYTLNRGPNND